MSLILGLRSPFMILPLDNPATQILGALVLEKSPSVGGVVAWETHP